LSNDLERLRSEIQAIRAHQGDVVLDSRGECCSNARVNAGFTPAYCGAFSISPPKVGKSKRNANDEVGERSRLRRRRFHSAGRMRYDCQPNLPDAREEAIRW
jgi:hypothetical protein